MSKEEKFIPLSVPVFMGNEKKYVNEALDSGWVSSAGPHVTKFEHDIANYVGAKYAVANSSGTAALHIALIESGVGSGDEVIVPTLTFIAPINTVHYVGADPVFMDCDDFLNMDVQKVEQFLAEECVFDGEKTINKKTGKHVKAVIPVHIFGNLVDMDHLMDLAEHYKLIVVEDATEALGSYFIKGRFKGKKAGTIGRFGCFSFNGNKIITTGGGGMIVTDDEKAALHMRYLTNQAKDDVEKSIHHEIGYNYRMTNLQAALGVAQLENLDIYIGIKRKNFETYDLLIKKVAGYGLIHEPDYSYGNLWFYSLVISADSDRDDMMARLLLKGIQTRPLWYLNHLQKPFHIFRAFKIEKAYHYLKHIISLPCSVNLEFENIERITISIAECSITSIL
jgi:perosamine synthetase